MGRSGARMGIEVQVGCGYMLVRAAHLRASMCVCVCVCVWSRACRVGCVLGVMWMGMVYGREDGKLSEWIYIGLVGG